MTIPKHGQVLGIDVGYSKKKLTTAACVLRWDEAEVTFDRPARTGASENFKKLKELVKGLSLQAVAIDGPLRQGLALGENYRLAERGLTLGFRSIGKPGQSSTPVGKQLHLGAVADAKLVLAHAGRIDDAGHDARIHEKAIAEAFPTSFAGVLLPGKPPQRGERSDVYFDHLLGPDTSEPPRPEKNLLSALLCSLLPGRTIPTRQIAALSDHEERAAFLCALTALCVRARQYVAVGDNEDGYIILPPMCRGQPAGLQPWAWDQLMANQRRAPSLKVIVEPASDKPADPAD